MGKYIDGGVSPGSFGPGPNKCPNAQATAWDGWSGKCFNIYGVGVVIADTSASIQGGFEVFNFNIHQDATQPAFPTLTNSNGLMGD